MRTPACRECLLDCIPEISGVLTQMSYVYLSIEARSHAMVFLRRFTTFKYLLRQELRDLIRRLLVHNPAQRLGVLKGGAADVKAHPWFHGFDWDNFAHKKLKAPYVPVVRTSFLDTCPGTAHAALCACNARPPGNRFFTHSLSALHVAVCARLRQIGLVCLAAVMRQTKCQRVP